MNFQISSRGEEFQSLGAANSGEQRPPDVSVLCFFDHDDTVVSVSWNPAFSTEIATASLDGTARILRVVEEGGSKLKDLSEAKAVVVSSGELDLEFILRKALDTLRPRFCSES